jgi:hypothetical protein
MASPIPAPRPASRERLPLLFGQETQLFGWQGLTAILPASWNLAHFGGKADNGNLRIDDEDGPRLEIRWQTPTNTVDLEKSIEKFMDSLARAAKKRGAAFTTSDPPRLVSKARKRKAQLVQFAWTGERDEPAAHGCGLAWQCADCGRVVVGHMTGGGTEKNEKTQRLASEIFGSLECHGAGGWQTWSVFGCRVEVPEEFELASAKLLTGRLEWEWKRPRAPGIFSFLERDERLKLARYSLAEVLLQHRTLQEWAEANIAHEDKMWRWRDWRPLENEEKSAQPAPVAASEQAIAARGVLRDLRLLMRKMVLDFILRRHPAPAGITVWHDAKENKLWAFSADLRAANRHVRTDLLDSLDSTS